MNLRERLKSETMDLHRKLEQQYPFSDLGKKEGIEKTATDFLSCMKAIYFEYLDKNHNKSDFHNRSYAFFKDFKCAEGFEFEAAIYQPLAYDYLLMGSRMGNRLIVRQNPAILETSVSEFFAMDLPSDVWKDFLRELDLVGDPQKATEIIKDAKTLFREMISIGSSLLD